MFESLNVNFMAIHSLAVEKSQSVAQTCFINFKLLEKQQSRRVETNQNQPVAICRKPWCCYAPCKSDGAYKNIYIYIHMLFWKQVRTLALCRRDGFIQQKLLSFHAPVLLISTIISFVLLTLTEELLSLLQLSGRLTLSQRCHQQKWWYDWADV